ncbi:MAG: hypothetical protein IJ737_07375 [Ruminococcus sp.]|nr:hypothetical protein [Ruminococcus sp.]
MNAPQPRSINTVDKRVIRTKRAIRNAFAELLTKKDINSITVTDIARLADINRKTFYNYYSGVYQVIEEIEEEISGDFIEAVNVDITQVLEDPLVTFKRLNEIINRDMDFYGSLFRISSNDILTKRLVISIKSRLLSQLMPSGFSELDRLKADISLEFILTGMISVYKYWYSSLPDLPIEELSGYVGLLTMKGIAGMEIPVRGKRSEVRG